MFVARLVWPFVVLILGAVHSEPNTFSSIGHVVNSRIKSFVGNAERVLQDDTTKSQCELRTNELIEHFGYDAEEHQVTTNDGYILTVFRCKSKNKALKDNGVVLLLHGLLCSSDDFAGFPKALAYVMADAGYDVWLINNRGNFYSKKHISKDPHVFFGAYWDFSWDLIGLYDYSAFIDFVREKTNRDKVHIIAHSQGTAAVMCLLSEWPEYNEKIIAISLMGPIGFLGHSTGIFGTLAQLSPLLQPVKNAEVLPRDYLAGFSGTICDTVAVGFCQTLINVFSGPSKGQRNDSTLPSLMCHFPSGISTDQLIHFGDEILHGYFGRRMKGSTVPKNFDLGQITAPIILQFSPSDIFSNPEDINRLIAELYNSLNYIHNVHEKFNHVDFIWGMFAHDIVYKKTLWYFDQYH